jgi:hypothetical protein
MKRAFCKTYTNSGTYKGVFTDFTFSSFTSSLNSGLGDLTINIPRRFDEYAINGDIELGNRVKVFISDVNGDDVLVYSGIIDEIDLAVSDSESVTISCSGYTTQLADDIYQESGVVYKKFSSTDPSSMLKAVIDTYRANYTNPEVNYTGSSVANTGLTETQEMYCNTYLEAIQLCAQLAPYTWFWRIEADGTFYFEEFPTTATHIFTVGRDIQNLRINRTIRTLQNGILFSNKMSGDDPESIFHLKEDATSVSNYGRKVKFISDGRYRLSSGTYVNRATRELNLYKDPINVVTLTVLDNNFGAGYDIESIKVGDTFRINNIVSNSAITNNMLITNITYNYTDVTITATDTTSYVNRLLAESRLQARHNEFSSNLPISYTAI